MTAFEKLMAYDHSTQALSQVAGRLGWDQETMMPPGAAPQRAEEMAAIESVVHERRTSTELSELLDAARAEALDETAAAQVREITRAHTRASKVPADLAAEIARVTSTSQGTWAAARAADCFADFAPMLDAVIRLKREEGQALAEGGDVYDAMLDDYEPGISAADLDRMFGALRPTLTDLRAQILDRPAPAALQGTFDETTQLRLSAKLAQVFGYDETYGRIDKAVHPFSSGSGLDVRITTRTVPHDPFNCFYSTIHEVGHACYEQNINRDFTLTALGRGVSMGVHESQSRIYENQLGRSRTFTGWLYREMRNSFGDFGIDNEDAFYACVNRISNGFIRTEADEVQYNLHVLMRFDLERALISGDLAVKDLQTAWNDRFLSDFGFEVDKASNGVLQDVHWSVGLFGYFPTYSLGNVYAGCLNAALRQAVPDLDKQMSQGDLSGATGWLRDRVQVFGSLYSPTETIERACGMTPSPEPLLEYLKEKFGQIYDL